MVYLEKIKNCPVCSSKKIYSLFNLKSIPLADNFSKKKIKTKKDILLPINPYICNNCTHVFLKHFVNQNHNYKNNFSYKTQVTKGLQTHFMSEIKKIIIENKIKKGSFCVDIGSNDGTILSILKKNKLKFVGIEPSISIAKYANQKGLKTINSFFNEKVVKKIIKKSKKPAMVLSTYTFANIKNLKKFLKTVSNLIASNGIFVIETGYHPKQMENNMFDYFYHEHFSYFSLRSIKYLLNSFGFKILKVKVTEPKSGSLLIVSKKCKFNKLQVSNTEKKILFSEKRKGVYTKYFYLKFMKKINFYKTKLHKKLDNIKKSGQKIIGYGASHSSTLLLHQFDLKKYLDFIVDDNVIKHNTFSPNHKIPVFSPSTMYKKKILNVLILAWNKKKYIIRKHKKFINKSGNFILPF